MFGGVQGAVSETKRINTELDEEEKKKQEQKRKDDMRRQRERTAAMKKAFGDFFKDPLGSIPGGVKDFAGKVAGITPGGIGARIKGLGGSLVGGAAGLGGGLAKQIAGPGKEPKRPEFVDLVSINKRLQTTLVDKKKEQVEKKKVDLLKIVADSTKATVEGIEGMGKSLNKIKIGFGK